MSIYKRYILNIKYIKFKSKDPDKKIFIAILVLNKTDFKALCTIRDNRWHVKMFIRW